MYMYHIHVNYVMMEKQKCIQCDDIMNLLDEKEIQYSDFQMTEIPNTMMTYLRMYCTSFPIVLNISNSFSNFEKTETHLITFELFLYVIFTLFLYIIFISLIILILES